MSVFGSLSTAVAGLAAQARSLGNLSDNIANSQTIGYKRVEGAFQSLVTTSNSEAHSPGGVTARPNYTNTVQGNISQSESVTNMAISGSGFFQVSRGAEGMREVAFQSEPLYTRAGDFSLDRFGYLKNSSGMYLNGWGLGSTGQIDKATISPIRIQQLIDTPSATQNITLSANLPLTPTAANLPPQTVAVIDAVGAEHELQLNWRQQAAGDWRLSIATPGSLAPAMSGTMAGVNDQAIGPAQITVPGVAPIRQQSSVDITSLVPGTTYSITINGKTLSYTAKPFDNMSTVGGNLVMAINNNFSTTGVYVDGLSGTSSLYHISLRGLPDGTPFGVSATPPSDVTTATNVAGQLGVKEEALVPISGTAGDVGDAFSLTFPGFPAETITYTTDGTEADALEIAKRIKELINADANAPMTAEVVSGGLKLTAKTASSVSVAPVAFAATNGTRTPYFNLKFERGYLSAIDTSHVGANGATTATNQNTGDPAYIQFQVDYGYGPQTIKLNLGKFGSAEAGLTQFVGNDMVTNSLSQDGFTRGAFQGLEIKASGDVFANYDNGRTRVLARVPIIQVTDPNAMRKADGNALALTREAGSTRADNPGENGAGGLVVSSTEGSNVDMAQEFTKLIVTQRAYSANTKVVSAVDEILNDLFGMKR